MVILAVLFVSLLVMTGAAFATIPCCAEACYKVTGTDLTNPANSFTQVWEFCPGGYPFGSVCNISGPTPLFLFAGFPEIALKDQVISFDSGTVGAYMKFHGRAGDIFNGLYYNGTDRFQIHGVEEPCPH